jgi:hypothetical protein
MRTRWLAAAVALLTVAACADPSGVLTTVGGDPVIR